MAARPRIIAVINQKGGVGKTTTAVNLGAALAEAGRRTCLIDLDPQAHLSLHLGIDPGEGGHTVYDLLIDPACDPEQCRLSARERLDVIPAETDLAAAETELAGHPDRLRILAGKLAPFLDDYEFVLMDCPPSLGVLTLNALAMATEVLVPMQAHFLALQGVGKLLETITLVSRSVNPGLSVMGIILCMHEPQTTLGREIVADLARFFEDARGQQVPWRSCRVLQPWIRRNIKLAEAPSFGKSIFDYSPWCAGANDYRRLARSLAEDRVDAPRAGAAEVEPPEIVTVAAAPPAPPPPPPAPPAAPAPAPPPAGAAAPARKRAARAAPAAPQAGRP